jgi:hypothetical protein
MTVKRSEVEMYSTLRHLTLTKTLNMKVTIDGQSIEVEPGTILQARMIGGEVVPPAMLLF